MKTHRVRTHKRPAHTLEIRLYYPSYGEWLSLDEYHYRRTLKQLDPTSALLKEEESFEAK
jgi:hypothetical protein